MRVVLDTNVIISATLIRGGREDQILRLWRRGGFHLVLSPQILEELGRALFYEKLQRTRWMSRAQVGELLQLLAQASVLVPGRLEIEASRDAEDDKFIVAAVEARAPFLVTGDRDLLALGSYRDVRIVRPAQFLSVIRRADA